MRPGRFAPVLFAFGILRLVELAYSNWNERRIREEDPGARQADPAGFQRMVAVNVGLFTLPLLEVVARRGRCDRSMLRAAGWAGQIGAVALRLWVIASLGRAWTVRAVVPSTLGVVERGPYRWIRHPNYIAVAVEFAALPLIGGAWVSALLLSLANGVVLRDRIIAEEHLLDRVPAYRERMGGKPRFFPRIGAISGR